MSKPIKALMRSELKRRLAGAENLAVVSLTGVDGMTSNKLRRELKAKNINVTVVKNSVAKAALDEMGLSGATALLEGPCALAYGGEGVVTIVREILGKIKDIPKLSVRGGYLEGEVFGKDRVDELSKYPTRDEAIGRAVAMVLSPGSKLVAAVLSSGSLVAGLLKQIEDNAKDKAPAEAAPAA